MEDLHWRREPPTQRGVYWAYKPNDSNTFKRASYTVLYFGDYRATEVRDAATLDWYKVEDFTHWCGPFPEIKETLPD